MIWFFLCFLAATLGILILFASQSNWDWFWNSYKNKRLVQLFGKSFARLITAFYGMVIVFFSILGITETLNSKYEIRDNSTKSNQRRELKQRLEYLKNEKNKLKNENSKLKQSLEYLKNYKGRNLPSLNK